jgi:hypothetical protein
VVGSPQTGAAGSHGNKKLQRRRGQKISLHSKHRHRPLRQGVLPGLAGRSAQTIAATATSSETPMVRLGCHRSRVCMVAFASERQRSGLPAIRIR